MTLLIIPADGMIFCNGVLWHSSGAQPGQRRELSRFNYPLCCTATNEGAGSNENAKESGKSCIYIIKLIMNEKVVEPHAST